MFEFAKDKNVTFLQNVFYPLKIIQTNVFCLSIGNAELLENTYFYISKIPTFLVK